MNTKTLWGEEFRVVDNGLAEVDVVKFIERLLIKNRVAEQRVAHLSSLNELAAKTVESAERLAKDIREAGEKEAAKRAEEIITEAKEEAARLIADANKQAAAVQEESWRAARERVNDIENTLASMAEWPEDELQFLSEVELRIKSFRGVFEGLVEMLKMRVEMQSHAGRFSAYEPSTYEQG